MSTINPGFAPIVPSQQDVVPSAAPAAAVPVAGTESTAPATPWFSIGQQRGFADLLGIALPSAPGDVATILARISLILEETTAEAEKNKVIVAMENARSLLGNGALEKLAAVMAAAAQKVEDNDAVLAVKRPQLQEQQAISDGYAADIATLNGQIDGLNSQIGTLNGQIGTLNGQIGTLNSQIAALPADSPQRPGLIAQRDAKIAERDGKTVQRDAKTTERDGKVGERDGIQALKDVVDAKIATLTAEITALETDNANQQATIRDKGATYAAIMFATMSVFVQLGTFFRTAESNIRGAEAGRSMQNDEVFDRLDETLAEISALDRMRNAAAALGDGAVDGAELNQRAVNLAVELVAGLSDALDALAGLEALPAIDSGTALERGARVRVNA
jgi:hypothetical protein